MSRVSALIKDPRIPGGSPEEIQQDYDLEVSMNHDETFLVEGSKENVDAYIEDYGIFVDIYDYNELD